jgi:hypothetical protein
MHVVKARTLEAKTKDKARILEAKSKAKARTLKAKAKDVIFCRHVRKTVRRVGNGYEKPNRTVLNFENRPDGFP